MKIAIGADHAGFELKDKIRQHRELERDVPRFTRDRRPQEGPAMKIGSLATPVLILLLSAVSTVAVAQDQDQRRFIDQLKKTPVSDIEAGMPQESFDSWFAGLVKPAAIDYEVTECTDDTLTSTGSPVLCINAYTKPAQPGWNRRIEIQFFVVVPPERTGGRVTVRPLVPRLLKACEGPSHPIMKRPSHCYPKLSDLEKLVRGHPIS